MEGTAYVYYPPDTVASAAAAGRSVFLTTSCLRSRMLRFRLCSWTGFRSALDAAAGDQIVHLPSLDLDLRSRDADASGEMLTGSKRAAAVPLEFAYCALCFMLMRASVVLAQ